METIAAKCARLVGALEDLTAQEAICLQARDFDALIGLQERAAPLIDFLVANANAVTDGGVRARVSAVLERRREIEAALSTEVARAQHTLDEVQARQRRVAKVLPAYGQAAPRRRQLSVVG